MQCRTRGRVMALACSLKQEVFRANGPPCDKTLQRRWIPVQEDTCVRGSDAERFRSMLEVREVRHEIVARARDRGFDVCSIAWSRTRTGRRAAHGAPQRVP